LPFFEYVAADANSSVKRGEMEAIDREKVIDYLKSENLLVVSVKEKTSGLRGWTISRKISHTDKINFVGNLATMMKAGVNLIKALDVISQETRNPYFQSILTDLKFSIENGKPLSESLSHYPKEFDQVFVNLVKAGEESGKLDESLNRLSIQMKKEYSLISKVKNALIYPVVLIIGVVGVMILIITFVIPKLATVFSSSTLKIPLTTKIIFFLAKIASYNPILTIAVTLGSLIIMAIILRLKPVRTFFKKILFRLPISSNLLKQMELVRFCRTAGGLLGSGLPINKVLDITAGGMSLPIYKKVVLDAKEKIIKGVSLANAFRGSEKYFPGILVSVISVGEKTGQLDTLLGGLADFYEEQADNTLKTLAGFVEPVLMVIVGLLIGGMAISIVVPIYQLIGTI